LLGFTSMFIAFAFIFVAIKNYRDNFLGGKIAFWTALKIGLAITFVAATFYVITWMIEFHFFIPDYMDKMIAAQTAHWKADGISQAEIQDNLKEMQQWKDLYKSPVMVALLTYMEILPMGIAVSLIASVILKKNTISAPKM